MKLNLLSVVERVVEMSRKNPGQRARKRFRKRQEAASAAAASAAAAEEATLNATVKIQSFYREYLSRKKKAEEKAVLDKIRRDLEACKIENMKKTLLTEFSQMYPELSYAIRKIQEDKISSTAIEALKDKFPQRKSVITKVSQKFLLTLGCKHSENSRMRGEISTLSHKIRMIEDTDVERASKEKLLKRIRTLETLLMSFNDENNQSEVRRTLYSLKGTINYYHKHISEITEDDYNFSLLPEIPKNYFSRGYRRFGKALGFIRRSDSYRANEWKESLNSCLSGH